MPKYRVIVEVEADEGEECSPLEAMSVLVWNIGDVLEFLGWERGGIRVVEEKTQWLSVYVPLDRPEEDNGSS
jgi:hypothetical protein